MQHCEVSVVIPVFNRQRLGERAVLSACAQAVAAMEIVVVDDGSQPPFRLPSIPRDANVRLLRLDVNSGASAARNAGIAAAQGEWIALLDSDDYWLPATLAPRLDFAKRELSGPDPTAFAAGFVVKKDESLNDVRIPREAETPEDFVCGCWFAPGSTGLFRKDVYRRVGAWDTELARLEDYDWFLRFALAGGRLKVWNAVAAVTEVEGKPPAAVLEAAARRLVRKYAGGDRGENWTPRMTRRLLAYLDVERASVCRYRSRWPAMLLYLARSFLRVPRASIHVRRFWTKGSPPPDSATGGIAAVRVQEATALNAGSCVVRGAVLDVITDPGSGGYSALLPVTPSDRYAGPALFRCRIDLAEGLVGIAAVTADYRIIAERQPSALGRQQLDLIVPNVRDVAGILVRNGAVTGRPSRASISVVAVDTYPADRILGIRRNPRSFRLQLPLRRCTDRAGHHDPGEPTTTSATLDTAATAAIVVDAWKNAGDRVTRNMAEKLAPTLAALRRCGLTIIHAPHDHDIHPLAQPLAGETVIPGALGDIDFVAAALRDAGIRHLLYLGYASNMCVLQRPTGMLEMSKRGFDAILVRDASAAEETADSVAGEWFHRAAIHLVETSIGATITAAELQAAVAEASMGSAVPSSLPAGRE